MRGCGPQAPKQAPGVVDARRSAAVYARVVGVRDLMWLRVVTNRVWSGCEKCRLAHAGISKCLQDDPLPHYYNPRRTPIPPIPNPHSGTVAASV